MKISLLLLKNKAKGLIFRTCFVLFITIALFLMIDLLAFSHFYKYKSFSSTDGYGILFEGETDFENAIIYCDNGVLCYLTDQSETPMGLEVCMQSPSSLTFENYINEYYDDILVIDTSNWREKKFSFLKKCVSKFLETDTCIIMPAKRGVNVFVPMFSLLKRKQKLYYIVIGGWLPEYLEKHKFLLFYLKRFDSIFVETEVMKVKLKKMNLLNVKVLVNFKNINPVSLEEVSTLKHTIPYHICTFSRVIKEKEIKDAIESVCFINNK